MRDKPTEGPIINFDAEPTAEEKSAVLEQLRVSMQRPTLPPIAALNLLYETACQCSGGSQATRYFLFWLAGMEDPTGYQGDGGLELRRLDRKRKEAAIEVLTWWAGPTQSDDPLTDVIDQLVRRFAAEPESNSKQPQRE